MFTCSFPTRGEEVLGGHIIKKGVAYQCYHSRRGRRKVFMNIRDWATANVRVIGGARV